MYQPEISSDVNQGNEPKRPSRYRLQKVIGFALLADAYFWGTLGPQPPRPEPQLTETEQIWVEIIQGQIEGN
jgi:hypothetical protein